MTKIAVVFWSGTGNTEEMAEAVASGAMAGGAEVECYTADAFSSNLLDDYDAYAFGCPSMGDEVLEEGDFQPMWDEVCNSLGEKKVAFFGSYGWGDGEWMRNWEAESTNLNLVGTFICTDGPRKNDVEECKALGQKLI